MEGVLLTLLLYFTPHQIIFGDPQMITIHFDTYAECEFYLEQHIPKINKNLENRLLGYSAKCDVL